MRISTEHAGVQNAHVGSHLASLAPYVADLRLASHDYAYASPESALATPSDTAVLEQVVALTAPLQQKVKTVLLVGIGGSDLGTRAVCDAVLGHTRAYGAHSDDVQLLSFSTVEPATLRAFERVLQQHVDPQEVVLVVISKSGNTVETIANANILFAQMCGKFGAEAAAQQTVVISGDDTPLATRAKEFGMHHLSLPKKVGGRFSVCTAVGLVPLALVGIDIRAFCAGASAGVHASVSENGVSSATVLASLLYESYGMGLDIHQIFLWHPELETLGKWYRQLLAESIGKEAYNGRRVGITPTVALGSIDLHSVGQLVFGGPRKRFTTFVAVPSAWVETQAFEDTSPFVMDMLQGKKAGDVMQAVYRGVMQSYVGHALPFAAIELESINARELGAFMGLHMASVMYLARLLQVNAFDQPNVESYKEETRKLLAQ